MVFQADMAFAMSLIALALGAFLFQQPAKGIVGKLVSYIVLVGSLLTLICVSINAYKAASVRGPSMPMRPMMMGPGHPGMMPQMMGPKPTTPSPASPTAPEKK